jgi:hypothetical protein
MAATRYARNGATRIAFECDLVSGVRDTAAQSRQAGAKWHGGRLPELRLPALVLHGKQDPVLRPAAARRTAAAIDGARLVLLPGWDMTCPPRCGRRWRGRCGPWPTGPRSAPAGNVRRGTPGRTKGSR